MARATIEQSTASLRQGAGSLNPQRVTASEADFAVTSPRVAAFYQQGLDNIKRAAQYVMNFTANKQEEQFKLQQSIWLNKTHVDAAHYWQEQLEAGNVPEDFNKFKEQFEGWQNETLKGIDDETRAKFIDQTEPMRGRLFRMHQQKVASARGTEATVTMSNVMGGWAALAGRYDAMTPEQGEELKAEIDAAADSVPTQDNIVAGAEAKKEVDSIVVRSSRDEQSLEQALSSTSLDDSEKVQYRNLFQQTQLVNAATRQSYVETTKKNVVDLLVNTNEPLPTKEEFARLYSGMQMAYGKQRAAFEKVGEEINAAFEAGAILRSSEGMSLPAIEFAVTQAEAGNLARGNAMVNEHLKNALTKKRDLLLKDNAAIPLNRLNPKADARVEYDANQSIIRYAETLYPKQGEEVDPEVQASAFKEAVEAEQARHFTRTEFLSSMGINSNDVRHFTNDKAKLIADTIKTGDMNQIRQIMPEIWVKSGAQGGFSHSIIGELEEHGLPMGAALAISGGSPDNNILEKILMPKEEFLKRNRANTPAEPTYDAWEKVANVPAMGRPNKDTKEIIGVNEEFFAKLDNLTAYIENFSDSPGVASRETRSAIFKLARFNHMQLGMNAQDAAESAYTSLFGHLKSINTGTGDALIDVRNGLEGVKPRIIQSGLNAERGRILFNLERGASDAKSFDELKSFAESADISLASLGLHEVEGSGFDMANFEQPDKEVSVLDYAFGLTGLGIGKMVFDKLSNSLEKSDSDIQMVKVKNRINTIARTARWVQVEGGFKMVYDAQDRLGRTEQVYIQGADGKDKFISNADIQASHQKAITEAMDEYAEANPSAPLGF